uniref:Uncharacterized protein n=1 Tax=Octopus bimaculoides TaxID=37653 RepID=A0A0L8FYT8_OCTBM
MSIICKNEQGWVVCHSKAVQDVYKHCRQEPPGSSTRSYRWKTDMFKIHSPFLMDTQFLKLRSDPKEHQPPIKKRKRRVSDLNVGEIQAKEYHEKSKLETPKQGRMVIFDGRFSGSRLTWGYTKPVITMNCTIPIIIIITIVIIIIITIVIIIIITIVIIIIITIVIIIIITIVIIIIITIVIIIIITIVIIIIITIVIIIIITIVIITIVIIIIITIVTIIIITIVIIIIII